jgi:hypothetical protein
VVAYDPYDSLVPVFIRTQSNHRPKQFATAVFFELHGEPFLLTAAHVTDERTNGELLVPTGAGFVPIEGYMSYIDVLPEERRGNDQIDIAYFRLSTHFANELAREFRVLPQARSQLLQSAHEFSVYSASGYPASKAKRRDELHYSEVFSFRGNVASQSVYEALGLAPDMSIVLHFHRKQALDHETFELTSTPGLSGISGGAIFAWPRGQEFSQDWSLPKLVGVVHSFKEKEGLIIGTTFLPIVAAILLGRMKHFGGIE